MIWAFVIALAIAAFAVAVVVFRLPRLTWTSLAAALVFGLAGYTLQASPDIAGAPHNLAAEAYEDDWQIVDSRELLVGRLSSSNSAVLTSDAFARRGQFEDAANFLSYVVADNPQDFEGWVALGNALTEQSDGVLTQAGVYAYREASKIAPNNAAPPYFLGLALIRQGRMMEAREVWRGALELMGDADSDEARAFMADRVERLDMMLGEAGVLPDDEAAQDGESEAETDD